MKVVPIRYGGPSVDNVLEDVTRAYDDGEIRSLVVTSVNTNGEIIVWGSGKLEDVCACALMVEEFARARLRGELDDTFPTDTGP